MNGVKISVKAVTTFLPSQVFVMDMVTLPPAKRMTTDSSQCHNLLYKLTKIADNLKLYTAKATMWERASWKGLAPVLHTTRTISSLSLEAWWSKYFSFDNGVNALVN